MYNLEYIRPESLEGAEKALGKGAATKALAGGMTLIPVLKQRLNKLTAVVDLSGLGLSGIKVENGHLAIGAMTTHAEIASSVEVRNRFPALVAMASNIGDRQVRSRGTIGGSLANNDPSACYPAAVLATGASIETNQRVIKASEFFQGMFTTALGTGELIQSVRFPFTERAGYAKFPNPASRYALVGVFVAKMQGCVGVAVTGAGQNGVFRHAAMETALGKSFNEAELDGVQTSAELMNDDIHVSAAYRAHLVGMMAKRAVSAALA
jgi:carbon-monoxide dehydrogenase medium subunit